MFSRKTCTGSYNIREPSGKQADPRERHSNKFFFYYQQWFIYIYTVYLMSLIQYNSLILWPPSLSLSVQARLYSSTKTPNKESLHLVPLYRAEPPATPVPLTVNYTRIWLSGSGGEQAVGIVSIPGVCKRTWLMILVVCCHFWISSAFMCASVMVRDSAVSMRMDTGVRNGITGTGPHFGKEAGDDIYILSLLCVPVSGSIAHSRSGIS